MNRGSLVICYWTEFGEPSHFQGTYWNPMTPRRMEMLVREQAARLAQLRRRQARLVARTSRCSACGARLGINPEPHAPYCPRRHRSTDG